MQSFQESFVRAPVDGLIKDLNAIHLPDGSWATCDQFHFIGDTVRKFLGWEKFNGAVAPLGANKVIYGTDFQKLDGITNYLIVGTATYLYLYDTATQTYTALNAVAFTMPDSYRWQSVPMNDNLYLVNGTDTPQQFDGTTLAAVPGDVNMPTTARFICNFVGHLVMANISITGTNYPSRIRGSDLDDPTNWTPAVDSEAFDITMSEDSASGITGICNWGHNRMLVFKNNIIYVIQYVGLPDIISKQTLPLNEGMPYPYSLVVVKDRIYFVGNHDIYAFTGSLNPIATDIIRDYLFDNILVDQPAAIYGFAHPFFTEIWWVFSSISSGGTTSDIIFDKAIVYNWETSKWSTRDLFPHSMLTSWVDRSIPRVIDLPGTVAALTGTLVDFVGPTRVMSGDANGNIFLHGGIATADGVALTGTLQTKDFALDAENSWKEMSSMAWQLVRAAPDISGNPTDTVNVTYGSRTQFTDSITFATAQELDMDGRVDMRLQDKLFAFKLTTDDVVSVLGYSYLWRPAGDRR